MRTLLVLLVSTIACVAQPVYPPAFWAPAAAAGGGGITAPGVAQTNIQAAGTSKTGFTNAVTVAAGNNRCMVVNVGWYGFSQDVSSLTYAGASFTRAYKTNYYNASVGGWCTQYYLVNPSTGNNDLALVMNGSTAELAMTALVLTNCAQSSVIGTSVGDFSSSGRNGVTNTVTTLTTDMVINNDTVASIGIRVYSPGPGQTQAAFANNGNNTSVLMSYQVGSAGTTSDSWTNSGTALQHTLISVPYHGQ